MTSGTDTIMHDCDKSPDGCSKTLTDLIIKNYGTFGISEEVAIHMCFDVPSCATVTGYDPPTMQDPYDGTSVYCKKSLSRKSQRITASHKFYGKEPRRDFVILKKEENCSQFPNSEFTPVCSARTLLLLRFGEECLRGS